MAIQLTADDAKQSLTAHVVTKGLEIREKYGPDIGWNELLLVLEDRSVCRYPCEIVFDTEPLREGEFAFPKAKGEIPEEGFIVCVHPSFKTQMDRVAYLVLYQLVLVNYGDFASPLDAEAFGAAALGITTGEYYRILCSLADEIGGCGGAACHCHE